MLLTKKMLLRSLESCPAGTRELVSAADGDIVEGGKGRKEEIRKAQERQTQSLL